MYDLTDRFLTADTLEESIVNKESVKNAIYSDYYEIFYNITNITTKLNYLTHGDISFKEANETTYKLLKLIKYIPEVNLKLSEEKKIEIPEKSSFLYSYKSQNEYQVQGGTYIVYEYNETIKDEITIYSYCAGAFFWDYIRTKRGSGYQVKVLLRTIRNKPYIQIYSLGKVFSPEKMDRLVNEAINASFSFDKCLANDIYKHINNKKNATLSYAEKKFEELTKQFEPKKLSNLQINEKEKEITYESVVNTMKEVFVNKPKRISILYYRGDISDEELEKQKKELDEKYYLNQDIINDRTEDIKYLEKLIN